jgi:hypothetical protein
MYETYNTLANNFMNLKEYTNDFGASEAIKKLESIREFSLAHIKELNKIEDTLDIKKGYKQLDAFMKVVKQFTTKYSYNESLNFAALQYAIQKKPIIDCFVSFDDSIPEYDDIWLAISTFYVNHEMEKSLINNFVFLILNPTLILDSFSMREKSTQFFSAVEMCIDILIQTKNVLAAQRLLDFMKTLNHWKEDKLLKLNTKIQNVIKKLPN